MRAIPAADAAPGPDPAPGPPEREVVWGPFPWRGWRLVAGLGLLVIGLVMSGLGVLRHTLTCARTGALAGQCELRGPLTTPSRFPLTALEGLRVSYSETRNKGHVTYHGRILLSVDGRPFALRSEGRAAADAHAAALRAFVADPAAQEISIATERTLALVLIGGLMALMGASFLYAVVMGRRRFRFTWDAPTAQLTVHTAGPLGLGARPPLTIALPEPREVVIRWGRVEDFWTSTRSPGPPGGWLVVRLADGSQVELSPSALELGAGQALRGYRVHIEAAERLRRLLGCPPRSTEEAARIQASYDAARPQVPPGWQGVSGKVAAVWLGACCGVLAGIAVSGVLAVALGFQKMSDSMGGIWFTLGGLGGAVGGITLTLRLTQRPDER